VEELNRKTKILLVTVGLFSFLATNIPLGIYFVFEQTIQSACSKYHSL